MKKNGIKFIERSFYQMPNHKEYLKLLSKSEKCPEQTKTMLAKKILDLEYEMPQSVTKDNLEKLFPTVSIIGIKI